MLDQLFADSQNKKQEKEQQQVDNKWKLKSNTWKWQKRIRAVTQTVSGCKVVQSGLNVHEIFILQTLENRDTFTFHFPFRGAMAFIFENVSIDHDNVVWINDNHRPVINYSEHTTTIHTLFGLN